MIRSISDILEKASQQSTTEEKVKYLQDHRNIGLVTTLIYAFDERVKFLLPRGQAPYKADITMVDQEQRLYGELKKFYLFTADAVTGQPGNVNLKQTKRESIFSSMLEALTPKDAALVVAVKDKKMPDFAKYITARIANMAFPEIQIPKSAYLNNKKGKGGDDQPRSWFPGFAELSLCEGFGDVQDDPSEKERQARELAAIAKAQPSLDALVINSEAVSTPLPDSIKGASAILSNVGR